MNKVGIILFLSVTICLACIQTENRSRFVSSKETVSNSLDSADTMSAVVEKDSLPDGVRKLLKAYPDAGMEYHDGYVVFHDGERIVYDDGLKKDFVTMLDNSDIEDMFAIRYDTCSSAPEYLADAGRSRCETLFKKMYGKSASQVTKNMETVEWFGQRIKFTRVNGASRKLRDIEKELSLMPHLRKYLTPASTFYWRNVRGANRMSAHSYGIAIDINVKMSDYWLWANPKKNETSRIAYKNRIPYELVRVFERHGFVWGGRWYHYDTMHFEYRPELLVD